MLQHFTWQQFLVAAMILSLIWYGAIALLFYRKQIREFLNGKREIDKSAEPLPHVWDEEFEEVKADNQDDLLGKSVLPEGMTRVSMSMFGFAPNEREQRVKQEVNKNWETEDDGRERQQGLVPDVLEELKSIFQILETEHGTKEDFISLFHLVSSKYPGIKGTSSQEVLNEHVRENVLFPISDKELDSLWV